MSIESTLEIENQEQLSFDCSRCGNDGDDVIVRQFDITLGEADETYVIACMDCDLNVDDDHPPGVELAKEGYQFNVQGSPIYRITSCVEDFAELFHLSEDDEE